MPYLPSWDATYALLPAMQRTEREAAVSVHRWTVVVGGHESGFMKMAEADLAEARDKLSLAWAERMGWAALNAALESQEVGPTLNDVVEGKTLRKP